MFEQFAFGAAQTVEFREREEDKAAHPVQQPRGKEDLAKKRAEAPRKRARTDASLLGGGKRAGPGTLGTETDPRVLIERWQSMASGAKSVELRRFYVLVAVVLAPQNASISARKALRALREFAQNAGHDDLTPAFLSRLDPQVVSDLIKMCNYRNNKAKYLVDIAAAVRLNMGRVAATKRGYEEYKGVGKELAALLMLVNTHEVANLRCAPLDPATKTIKTAS